MPEAGPPTINTRGSVRFLAELSGEVRAGDGPGIPLVTLNVSTGGVLARTGRPVTPLDQVAFRLPLGAGTFESQAVCLRATAAHPYEAAFFFLDTDPPQRMALLDYLQGRFQTYA